MNIFLLFLWIVPSFSFTQDNNDYPQFTYVQMTNIASPSRLSHRVFYKKSTGENAQWFDTVKKGDLDLIKKMVNQGQHF